MESSGSRLLDTWKEDPGWTDEIPQVQVSRPKGAFCQLDCTAVVGMHPAAVFETMCDTGNQRIFRNAQGVRNRTVVEQSPGRKVVELEMVQSWHFLFLSGEFGVNLRLTQDKVNQKLYFELSKPGFMKKFRGVWSVEPVPIPPSRLRLDGASPSMRPQTAVGRPSLASLGRISSTIAASAISSGPNLQAADLTEYALQLADVEEVEEADQSLLTSADSMGPTSMPWFGKGTRVASRVLLSQQVQPALQPPPLFAQYLRGIAAKSILEAMVDIQMEAARLRHGLPEDCDVVSELEKKGYFPPLVVSRAGDGDSHGQGPKVGHRFTKKKSQLRDWSVAEGRRMTLSRRSKRLSEKEKWKFSKSLERELKEHCPSVKIAA